MAVEEGALRARVEQRLMLVLAVDVDEQTAEKLEVLQRRGLAVDERARAAVGADHAAQRALRPLVEAALPKPVDRRVPRWAVELHADLRALGARAHGARVGAIAEREAERVHEDRLAGAGLAGHHAEAARELELDLVDDRVVPDLDQAQHSSQPRRTDESLRFARPQLSFERSSS